MIHDLTNDQKLQIREYIKERSPGSEEIADALLWVAETHPKELRTKELCETLEAVTLIGARINAHLASTNNKSTPGAKRKKESIMTIYDLACGHGLAGVLLAYRFPKVRVRCIDRERRPCWNTYIEAFEGFGTKSPGNDTVMANLNFEEGDIMKSETLQQVLPGDYLICLHGCNELSPHVISAAIERRAGYAVMPCCLREKMLGLSTHSSNCNWGIMDDTARYALQVGYLAGKFQCAKVVAISHWITNRFLIIIGDIII